MRYLDELRDPELARGLVERLNRITTQPWSLMEVCGGQTHAIVRYGIDELLPPGVELIHGPGCPVCVTPVEKLDTALALAARPEVIFCSFGDMLRVPGSESDLLQVKARGGDVRTVYSPLDALHIAAEHPRRQVVFFAVGFETTAPATAMAVAEAERKGLSNFSLLVSHVLVPPALECLLSAPQARVQGLLAAGHVCTVMGTEAYRPIAARHRIPIVVTGFEPVDLLQGILSCVQQLESGRAEVDNQYSRVVRREGNPSAQALIAQVFEPAPQAWRGLGEIGDSGLRLRARYREFDAERRFGAAPRVAPQAPCQCIAGEVLQGLKKPAQCPAFGGACTPDRPLGAPMVSQEGACAAYFRYRRAGGSPTHSAR